MSFLKSEDSDIQDPSLIENIHVTPERWYLLDEAVYPWLVGGMFVFAAVTLFGVRRKTAPYGRHVQRGYGPTVGVREGWIIMESPALWATTLFYSMGDHKVSRVPLILLRFFQFHYFNRTVIYPIRMKVQGKGIPVLIVVMLFIFNIYNGYLQGRWLSHFGSYDPSWLTTPQFIIGATLFVTGFVINFWSDSILLSLRDDEHDRNYRIPRGFLFEFVTCPNYFGEIVEWLGWSILTWSPAALAFFAFTVANLVPRATANHQWYLKKFVDYPKERKYLVPFIY